MTYCSERLNRRKWAIATFRGVRPSLLPYLRNSDLCRRTAIGRATLRVKVCFYRRQLCDVKLAGIGFRGGQVALRLIIWSMMKMTRTLGFFNTYGSCVWCNDCVAPHGVSNWSGDARIQGRIFGCRGRIPMLLGKMVVVTSITTWPSC